MRTPDLALVFGSALSGHCGCFLSAPLAVPASSKKGQRMGKKAPFDFFCDLCPGAAALPEANVASVGFVARASSKKEGKDGEKFFFTFCDIATTPRPAKATWHPLLLAGFCGPYSYAKMCILLRVKNHKRLSYFHTLFGCSGGGKDGHDTDDTYYVIFLLNRDTHPPGFSFLPPVCARPPDLHTRFLPSVSNLWRLQQPWKGTSRSKKGSFGCVLLRS